MLPEDTAEGYDRLATWWRDRHSHSDYGLSQLERAMSWVETPGRALDVGCGSSGRFIQAMLDRGFEVEGLDVSEEMIRHAREIHPDCVFHVGDVAEIDLPGPYSLVTAWDSTFHLPLEAQRPALDRMVASLAPGGVLLFTGGGCEEPGSIEGGFEGERFAYSTLGVPGFLSALGQLGLAIKHVEYDQGPGERHVVFIARREKA